MTIWNVFLQCLNLNTDAVVKLQTAAPSQLRFVVLWKNSAFVLVNNMQHLCFMITMFLLKIVCYHIVVLRNTVLIIWYNITIWYGNIAILYGTTQSLLKYTYNIVGLRRISFFSEIRSQRSVTAFFAQTPPPPPTKKCTRGAAPISL